MICKTYGKKAELNEEFDSYYCLTCDKWLEKKCSDPKCEYCTKRPNKPSEKK